MKFTSAISLIVMIINYQAVSSSAATECLLGPGLEPSETLVGYIRAPIRRSQKTGSFNALLVLEKGLVRPTDGSAVKEGMRFWLPLSPEQAPVALNGVSAYLERLGPDHCVYHAEVSRRLPDWTIVSTRPLHRVLRAPSARDQERFYRLNTECVHQGDPPPGTTLPCARPRLIAVSDVDMDGNEEYWYTQPYRWDTGFTVAEVMDEGRLRVLVSACPGCSD